LSPDPFTDGAFMVHIY